MPITPTSTKSKQYQALGIDEIARDIETAFTSINALEAGGGSEYTETIVNISSAQILAMASSPIELLPAAGEGKYYDIEKIILEYTHVTTAYTLADPYLTLRNGFDNAYILSAFLTQSNNRFSILRQFTPSFNDTVEGINYHNYLPLNSDLVLSTYNSTNPTDGDGTLRVKIYHKTVTFGA